MANIHRILRLSEPPKQLGIRIQDIRPITYYSPIRWTSCINDRGILL